MTLPRCKELCATSAFLPATGLELLSHEMIESAGLPTQNDVCLIVAECGFMKMTTSGAQSRPSHAVTVAALIPSLAVGVRALRHRMIPIGLIKCNLVVPAATRSRFSLKHLMAPRKKRVFHVQCFKQTCPRTYRDRGNICFCIGPRLFVRTPMAGSAKLLEIQPLTVYRLGRRTLACAVIQAACEIPLEWLRPARHPSAYRRYRAFVDFYSTRPAAPIRPAFQIFIATRPPLRSKS